MAERQLIGIRSLEKELGSENLRIIDCRFDLADFDAGRAQYLAGHIPGAVFADLNDDLAARPAKHTGRHPLPSVDEASEMFGRLGIDHSCDVVVYDGGNGALAARAWWMLRWLGHAQVRLLDGGFSAWQGAALPVESGPTEVQARAFLPDVQHGKIATTNEIAAAAPRFAGMKLIDARDATRFTGENEPIDSVAGHIPGAINLPLTVSLRADGHWKDREERAAIWRETLDSKQDAKWIAMCGSGVTACHLALSAVDAGFAEPRLYVGSWSEWIADPSRPIAASRT